MEDGNDEGSVAEPGSLTEIVNDSYDNSGLPIADDDEFEDSSEGDPDKSPYARPRQGNRSRADERGDDGGEPSRRRPSDREARGDESPAEDSSYSRLRLNHSRASRQLTESQARVRALETEVKRLADSSRSGHVPEDVVDHVREVLASRMGIKSDDPRIIEALRELSTDLTVEAFSDIASPELLERKSQRARERQEREWRSSQERKLDEMRLERVRDQQAVAAERVRSLVGGYVRDTAVDFPFMSSAAEAEGFDASDFLIDAASRGISDGVFADPQNEEQMQDLLHTISRRADEYYRGVAEKLSSRLNRGVQSDGRDRTQPSRRGPAEKRAEAGRVEQVRRPQQKAAPSRGGGGRGTPSSQAQVDGYDNNGYRDETDDSLAAFVRRNSRAQGKGR